MASDNHPQRVAIYVIELMREKLTLAVQSRLNCGSSLRETLNYHDVFGPLTSALSPLYHSTPVGWSQRGLFRIRLCQSRTATNL
jgi:hypothetical protein